MFPSHASLEQIESFLHGQPQVDPPKFSFAFGHSREQTQFLRPFIGSNDFKLDQNESDIHFLPSGPTHFCALF